MILVLVPIAFLLLVGLARPGKAPLSVTKLLLVLLGGVGVFLFLRSLLPEDWIYPESDPAMLVHRQLHVLKEHPNWKQHPVLILEGSSATEYGLKGELLEQLLAEAGYQVAVLQFSLSGANHLERLWILSLFFQKIGSSGRQELHQAPTLLLSELFDDYDRDPLYLFEKEAYSHQTVAWSSPQTAWRIKLMQLSLSWQTRWMLWEHLLLNRFGVASFSTMEPLNYGKEKEGFFGLQGTKEGFHYEEMVQQLEKESAGYTKEPALSHTGSSSGIGSNATTAETDQEALPYPGWNSYQKELQKVITPMIQQEIFYALPTLEPHRRAYQIAFAQEMRKKETIIGPPSLNWMQQHLLHSSYWFDGVHPQTEGAERVTSWFAQQLERLFAQHPELLRNKGD